MFGVSLQAPLVEPYFCWGMTYICCPWTGSSREGDLLCALVAVCDLAGASHTWTPRDGGATVLYIKGAADTDMFRICCAEDGVSIFC